MRCLLAFIAACLLALPALADPVAAAQQLFERYVRLGEAFDPALADLYADDATIRNKRTYPTGEVRELSLPAPQYKALLRAAMPMAKARGDRSTYLDVRYVPEGEGVRIVATRHSELKRYASPLSLLLKPDANGQWRIAEELSESGP